MARKREIKIALIFLFGIILAADIFPKDFKSGEILLFEKPQNLALYDKYKRELDAESKAKIAPFQPFFVRGYDENSPLQLYLECETNGNVIFIGMKSRERFVTRGDIGRLRVLRDFKKVSGKKIDTSKLAKVRFLSFRTGKEKTASTRAGIKPIATKGSRCLVKVGGEYGLATISEKYFVSSAENESDAKLTREILDEVEKYFNNANLKLEKVYQALNTKENQSISPPKWKKISDYNYRFENGNLQNFMNVKNYLLSKINLLLLDLNYKAIAKENEIKIVED